MSAFNAGLQAAVNISLGIIVFGITGRFVAFLQRRMKDGRLKRILLRRL
ncbi:MAG: hypothetical protein HMLKMBBP_01541 [Planctomycetes bacterium]|nr:hypothetical protein [Planctomycetota bacterium]